METDDFGFQQYLGGATIEVLPPATYTDSSRVGCSPLAFGRRITNRCLAATFFASLTLFGSGLAIARSSHNLDAWRDHGLRTAQMATPFMVGSVAWLAFSRRNRNAL